MTPIEQDLRQVFHHYPTERLLALLQAFEQDRVIRQQYADASGRRCLLGHLDPSITSKEKLQEAFPTEQSYPAPRDVVRAWDDGRLTEAMVLRQLLRDLAERRGPAARAAPLPRS
jgi:hypothetical protein